MSNLQVAKTILEQLGGNKFIAMTGAKNLVGGETSLSFKIGRNAKKISHVRIELDPSDTYTIKFLRVRKLEVKEVSSFSGVYNDQLQAVFTANTELYTSLGTLGRTA
jgi:hypothetical protein